MALPDSYALFSLPGENDGNKWVHWALEHRPNTSKPADLLDNEALELAALIIVDLRNKVQQMHLQNGTMFFICTVIQMVKAVVIWFT